MFITFFNLAIFLQQKYSKKNNTSDLVIKSNYFFLNSFHEEGTVPIQLKQRKKKIKPFSEQFNIFMLFLTDISTNIIGKVQRQQSAGMMIKIIVWYLNWKPIYNQSWKQSVEFQSLYNVRGGRRSTARLMGFISAPSPKALLILDWKAISTMRSYITESLGMPSFHNWPMTWITLQFRFLRYQSKSTKSMYWQQNDKTSIDFNFPTFLWPITFSWILFLFFHRHSFSQE